MSRLKFLISSAVFIVMTAVKLTFPGFADEMYTTMLPRLDANADFKGAMTSLGEMITGDEGIISALARFYEVQTANGDSLSGASDIQEPEQTGGQEGLEERPSPEVAGAQPSEESAKESEEPETKEPEPTMEELEPTMEELEPADESPLPAAEESAPQEETIPEAVTVFLETQERYEGHELPSNVSISLADIPFEYVAPVEGYNSSGFGFRRHPLDGEIKFHYGTDIAAYAGMYIYAFGAGTVLVAGDSDSYGLYIIIGHAGGYSTLYAHCSELLVESGEIVEKGQLIAQVGATGAVTGAHLHFELMKDNLYLNPEFYV